MKRVCYYKTCSGEEPFKEWLYELKDARAKTKIVMRIDRLCLGNPGDHASCGSGVWELRIDQGPGYRIYYAIEGRDVYLNLVGGDKRTHQADIHQAVTWWKQRLKGKIL